MLKLNAGVAVSDVLAGRKTVGSISGNIAFAGQHASPCFLRRYTGYVEQFGQCLMPQDQTSDQSSRLLDRCSTLLILCMALELQLAI